MTLYQILTICGLPSLLTAVIGFLVGKLRSNRKKDEEWRKAIEDGIKSQLKYSLLSSYNSCVREGKSTVDAEVWNDMYKSYIALGGNGMMKDDIKPKFDRLPIVITE